MKYIFYIWDISAPLKSMNIFYNTIGSFKRYKVKIGHVLNPYITIKPENEQISL